MKQPLLTRLISLTLALCLCVLPTLALADTYLPDGEVTHTDFTLDVSLHADGFPQSKAHLSDWETFLNKLDIKGSIDTLAMFTPTSRVYLNGALRLNGKSQIPFVYDGYHSYRYLITPALNNEPLFFQMHNFLEFMLKPYYYMELPTQYMALLMYPEAAYWIGDSYYTPLTETLAAAKEEAISNAADEAALQDEQAADALANEAATPAVETQATTTDTTATLAPTATPQPTATPEPTVTPVPVVAEDGTITYNVPYEDLYELCENLDLIVNDDLDYSRAYFFFTCLLTDLYASDMTLEILGNLEAGLDAIDPDENGMTVVETADTTTCTLGDVDLFVKATQGDVTTMTLTLPTAEGYVLTFDYRWDKAATASGATLDATLTVTSDGEDAIVLSAQGTGLPREGDISGQGQITLAASGNMLQEDTAPFTLAFDWVRDATQKPYTLDLKADWIHPETGKPAISLHFNGTLSDVDKSVFAEGNYVQNDFFNLNETFLSEYKERLMPAFMLKVAPILLETPSGVLNDLYSFAEKNDILVSFVE